jgi:hypothetical protein
MGIRGGKKFVKMGKPYSFFHDVIHSGKGLLNRFKYLLSDPFSFFNFVSVASARHQL